MIETFLDANFSSSSSLERLESEVSEKVTEKEKGPGSGSGSVKAFAASLVQEIKVRPSPSLLSFLPY